MEYKSSVFYTAGEVTYNFPFKYLEKKFVKVRYRHPDGSYTNLNYNTDYSVEGNMVNLRAAGAFDDVINIYRETSSESIVNFNDASVLRASDLNVYQTQLLHIAEENYDNLTSRAMAINTATGQWDATEFRVTRVADPVDPTDTVNLRTLERWDTHANDARRYAEQGQEALRATQDTLEETRRTFDEQLAVHEGVLNQTKGVLKETQDTLEETNGVFEETQNMADRKIAQIERFVQQLDPENIVTKPSLEATLQDFVQQLDPENIVTKQSLGGILQETDIFIRKPSKEYEVGDVAYSPLLHSWQRLECVVAGVTSSDALDATLSSTGLYIEDGTVTWIVTDIRDGDRVGDITLHPTLLPGHILADGATVTASDYPRLLAWAQANNMITTDTADVSKYRYDAGNDTLVVPNSINRVLQGAASVATKGAGLPNISGVVKFSCVEAPDATGAMYVTQAWDYNTYVSATKNRVTAPQIGINASRSSSIYGASTTVQPPALTQIPQIKY